MPVDPPNGQDKPPPAAEPPAAEEDAPASRTRSTGRNAGSLRAALSSRNTANQTSADKIVRRAAAESADTAAPRSLEQEADDAAVAAARLRMQTSRRALVAGGSTDARQPDSPRRKARRAVVRLPILIAFIVLVLAGVGLVVSQLHYEDGSDLGIVRRQLITWEFTRDPATRDAVVVPIDQMGIKGMQLAISLLTDASKAELGSSHSDTPVRNLAAAYLLRVAAIRKVDPPPLATEVAKNIFDGAGAAPAKWQDLQKAWTAWLADGQAKGVIKPP